MGDRILGPAELVDLGRRALAAYGRPWLWHGARDGWGARHVLADGGVRVLDVSDAATQGVLLGVLRGRDPLMSVESSWDGDEAVEWSVTKPLVHGRRVVARGFTYEAAIVAALDVEP